MAKRRKVSQHGRHAKPQRTRGKNPGQKPQTTQTQPPKKKQQHQQRQQHQRPIIPFSPNDAILLVGEGDLSFARSLVEHHGCTDVTATVLEKDLSELTAKYPHVPDNVAAIEASSRRSKVVFGVDARTMAAFKAKKRPPVAARGGSGSVGSVGSVGIGSGGHGGGGGDNNYKNNISNITTSSSSPSSSSPSSGPVVGTKDRIIFNFPHVGGKSTDVNRQVRYNQELLVDFFRRADSSLAPGGSIVVTLFEGEPYTLWNVRDLARHAGLQVERSFAFRADAYPGYRHARTLGALRNKQGELSAGGWKGEDRPAKSYVFFRKGEVHRLPQPPVSASLSSKNKKRKRKRSDDGSDDSSSESEAESGDDGGGGGDGDSDSPGCSEDCDDDDEEGSSGNGEEEAESEGDDDGDEEEEEEEASESEPR